MNSRNIQLDIIKLIAMCGVMCLHTQIFYINSPIAHFLYITSVFSIPLFFMTSGYLLLGKKKVDYKYSISKIFGILRFVIIMTLLFYFIFGIRHGVSFINATLGSLIQKGELPIYWYFGAMIIIYILFPFLNYIYKCHYKYFLSLLVLLLISLSVIFLLNFTNEMHIEQNTIQTFRLWNWLFYFCLGGYLKRYSFHVSVYAVIFFIIINYLFQINTVKYINSVLCEYYYPSIPVMLLSASIFQYIRYTKPKLENLNIGVLFLPCYTIHMQIIGRIRNIFEYLFSFTGILLPLLFWFFICIVLIIISLLIMKIPYSTKIFRI